MLRREAVARIEELTRAGSDDTIYDPELAEAIVADDGGPAREREGHAIAMQGSETNSPPISRATEHRRDALVAEWSRPGEPSSSALSRPRRWSSIAV